MSKLILYWLRASWKSTVGKELAEKTWKTFVDLDEYIVEKIEMTVTEFVEANGWNAFRDLEYECLQEVLESDYDIVSLWWWTIEFPRNREAIDAYNVKVAYLFVDTKTQLDRILWDNEGNKNRPSLTDETLEKELEEIYKKRHMIYYWFAKMRPEKDTDSRDGLMISAKQATWKTINTLENWK